MKDLLKSILVEFTRIQKYAEENQVCLRKAVGCSLGFIKDVFRPAITNHNGPSREGHPCSNVVGNCGCSHSEPRACMAARALGIQGEKVTRIMVCTFSPCTNCANIILDSGCVDVVVYHILTEHDKRGAEFLNDAIQVVTRQQLEMLLTECELRELSKQGKKLYDQIAKWNTSNRDLGAS